MELPHGLVYEQGITTFQLARTFVLNALLHSLVFYLNTVTYAQHQPANSTFLRRFLLVFNMDLFKFTEALRLIKVKTKSLVS